VRDHFTADLRSRRLTTVSSPGLDTFDDHLVNETEVAILHDHAVG
jgi:hypothetical protein